MATKCTVLPFLVAWLCYKISYAGSGVAKDERTCTMNVFNLANEWSTP